MYSYLELIVYVDYSIMKKIAYLLIQLTLKLFIQYVLDIFTLEMSPF